MAKNMGSVDRIIRTILGVGLVVAAIIVGGWVWVLGGLGVVFIGTSLVSTCPLYMPFRISTRRSNS